jgi:hypothetical protein
MYDTEIMDSPLERGRKPRWGLILSVANAGAGSGLTIYLLQEWRRDPFRGESPGPGWIILTIVGLAVASAWIAAWSWWTERWGLASLALVLSLAMPWGYLVELSAPMVLGLATVAGVRASRRRRQRRADERSAGGVSGRHVFET